jgi:hypothetical protein
MEIQKLSNRVISNLYSFSYPLIIAVVVVFFTWPGEQSEFSSTLRVKQKKHVSKYTLSDQKRSKTVLSSWIYPACTLTCQYQLCREKQRAYTTQLRYYGSSTIDHRQRQDVSARFGLRQTFGLIYIMVVLFPFR